uniref:CTCK domain-containing protein n=1 Tax=Balaenoptera musculus TaxID=9771 RepID=A0A8C0CSX4_BALMU
LDTNLFAPCHAVASPKHYYEACISDSFTVPDSSLECASLQTYAALCAQEGICVDWRSHTGGACLVTCPEHREYRACGPVEEPTCKSRSAKSPRLVEGCFCPKGTTSYASGFDVCVGLCGRLPFGEHFEFDCKDCICLEGGSGIICRPKTCRPVPFVECKEDGTYTVTEVDPANTCCNITSCGKAPAGQGAGLAPLPHGFWRWGPQGVSAGEWASVGPWGSRPRVPLLRDPALRGVASGLGQRGAELTGASPPPSACNPSLCRGKPPLCPLGFEVKSEMVPGRCCPFYSCGRWAGVGEEGGLGPAAGPGLGDPLNNCTFFSCMKIHGQFISSVSKITCPDFDPSTCLPVSGPVTAGSGGPRRLPRNETRIFCSTVPVVREISHNGCTKLVTMNDCSGSCETFAMYSAKAQSLDHSCSCCKEQSTSQREVMLQCPGGGLLRHTYTHIDSCLCQDTVCELPPQRRARRSGPRDLGPGRG